MAAYGHMYLLLQFCMLVHRLVHNPGEMTKGHHISMLPMLDVIVIDDADYTAHLVDCLLQTSSKDDIYALH